MVSLRLGSDALGKTQNTWKLPDISSLHNVSKTGTSIAFDEGANLYFLQKTICTHAPEALREGAKRLATRYRAVLLPHSTLDQIAHTGR